MRKLIVSNLSHWMVITKERIEVSTRYLTISTKITHGDQNFDFYND